MVDDVVQANGKYVLVAQIPAEVCARCGEETFSSETTEKIRAVLHDEQASPTTTIKMDVFDFSYLATPTDDNLN